MAAGSEGGGDEGPGSSGGPVASSTGLGCVEMCTQLEATVRMVDGSVSRVALELLAPAELEHQ